MIRITLASILLVSILLGCNSYISKINTPEELGAVTAATVETTAKATSALCEAQTLSKEECAIVLSKFREVEDNILKAHSALELAREAEEEVIKNLYQAEAHAWFRAADTVLEAIKDLLKVYQEN